ncbi:outer membrane protein assembly factor BamD [Moraxella nasovis]|uniref:outer membrane protein assembly factor BamD n=1 Tax=Moraxella nasovis TaxID=2904121 RepID=UPI001F60E04B|nr:outer membrane protein assembly factor BamD [Moraxella nasovis]UNU73400.1 outer membrane protein assembly factor BamD [Moraxella nasovis]
MKTNHSLKVLSVAMLAGTLALSGCSTLKSIVGKKDNKITISAEQSELSYYEQAQAALEKGNYHEAIKTLGDARTFYPTGTHAQQALLDLIYAQYQAGDYEAVSNSTAEFLRLYPTSRHLDYVLYVQGVTHMGGSPKASRLFKLDQSQRDVSWLQLAFNNFQVLVNNFPNSNYAPDAAQRMIAIYNDLAEHEMVAARWYVKRDAYVAAVNRAKWVFQYYPQSESTPEAIAVLAYSYDKLGMTTTAEQYKTLLQINYPSYLNADGSVKLPNQKSTSFTKRLLNTVTLHKFDKKADTQGVVSSYNGQTRNQVIHQAGGLPPLPSQPAEMDDSKEHMSMPIQEKRRHIGLSLPDQQ